LFTGKSFVVIQPDVFMNDILGDIFPRQAKYTSFIRKLSRWGFVRLTNGTGSDCFHHPLFQRNRYDLASKIGSMPRNVNGSSRKRVTLITTGGDPPSWAGVEKSVTAKSNKGIDVSAPSTSSTISGEEEESNRSFTEVDEEYSEEGSSG
jgi:hypothetical protein